MKFKQIHKTLDGKVSIFDWDYKAAPIKVNNNMINTWRNGSTISSSGPFQIETQISKIGTHYSCQRGKI
jgi:hypothetical protein